MDWEWGLISDPGDREKRLIVLNQMEEFIYIQTNSDG